jgi:hypothetical protein
MILMDTAIWSKGEIISLIQCWMGLIIWVIDVYENFDLFKP